MRITQITFSRICREVQISAYHNVYDPRAVRKGSVVLTSTSEAVSVDGDDAERFSYGGRCGALL